MRLLEVLEVFGMVWKVLEGFAGFGGSCEAMRSFERRGEALGGFIDFGSLCHALGGFGFARLWEAIWERKLNQDPLNIHSKRHQKNNRNNKIS